MLKLPEKITAEWLQEQGACVNSVCWFKSLWPHGVKCTRNAAGQAAAAGMDIFWVLWHTWDDVNCDLYRLARAYTRAFMPREAGVGLEVAAFFATLSGNYSKLFWVLRTSRRVQNSLRLFAAEWALKLKAPNGTKLKDYDEE